MNKVTVTCYRFWSDWTDLVSVEIDIDEYNWFELQYRQDRWFIIGSKYENDKWHYTDLTIHGIVSIKDVANFIKVASKKINKFSTLNSMPNLIDYINEIHNYLN